MKKTQKFKLIGIICVLSFALVFIGLSFLQAGEQGKDKPPDKGKPKEVNWGVQVPETSFNLFGKEAGYIYWNNDGDIQVDVEKLKTYGKEKTPYYVFQLILSNPENWMGFQDVVFTDPSTPDPDKDPCIFPEGCNAEDPPDCMACFLNGQHPRAGYHHLRIAFSFHDYEIEDMAVGDIYQALHEKDTISISAWYSSDCFQEYHNLGNWVRPVEGLFLERISENEWRISVSQPLTFRESYCEEIPTGKGNRTRQETYTPLIATGFFNFQMDWIKQ